MRSRALIPAAIAACSLLSFLACGQQSDGEPPPTGGGSPRDRVMTVSLSTRVGDVESSADVLRGLIARHEGYVQSATSSADRASFVAQVPVSQLAAFRDDVRELGELDREEEQVEDVTAQRMDRGVRLRNAQREEERLLALMSERTASLSDVIAIEERLSALRERIEGLEAEERALAQRIEHAEVHVELARRPIPFWEEPVATLSSAAAWGVDAAAAVVVGGAAVAASLGPMLIIFLSAMVPLVFGLRTIGRRLART